MKPKHGDKKCVNGKWYVYNAICWDIHSGAFKTALGTVNYHKKGAWVDCVYNQGKWI